MFGGFGYALEFKEIVLAQDRRENNTKLVWMDAVSCSSGNTT